jgi:hypothetical protein
MKDFLHGASGVEARGFESKSCRMQGGGGRGEGRRRKALLGVSSPEFAEAREEEEEGITRRKRRKASFAYEFQ